MKISTVQTSETQELIDIIHSSSLLLLPIEKRKAMVAHPDARLKEFIELLILREYGESPLERYGKNTLPPRDIQKMEYMGVFYETALNAFCAYDANISTVNGFLAYLDTSVRNRIATEQRRNARQNCVNWLSKNDSRLLREILELTEVSAQELSKNFNLCSQIADVFKISTEKLQQLLAAREYVQSINETNDDGSVRIELADDTDIALEIEAKEMVQFSRILALLDLEEKESYAQKYGLFWSNSILLYLRGNERYRGNHRSKNAQDSIAFTPDKAADAITRANKLARCDDLAPLDKANCLWEVLLLEKYVDFLIAEPLPARQLPPVAINALKDERYPPSNKAIAEYLGKKGSAVSQKMKTWKKDTKAAIEKIMYEEEII